jgi:hypothetical protein
LSGFGNTGTLSAGLTFSTLNGGSIVNDAGNKVLSYPSANFSTNNFTMEAWVSVKSYPGTNAVFISNRGTSDNGWLLDVTSNKKGRIFIQRDAGASYSLETINDLGLNKWTNLSVVRNGTNLSLYRDGVLQNSTTLPSNYNIQSAYANDYVTRYFTSNGALDGNVSTIKYYNRALTQQEISQNYNATKKRFVNALPPVRNGLVMELDAGQRSSYPGTGNTWYDLSGNGYNYILTNGPTFSGVGISSNIVFDGSNDRALAVNPISLGTLHTVSMIIKPSSSGVLFGDFAYNNTGYAFYSAGSTLYYAVSDYVSTSITLSGAWTMLTVTRNGTSIVFYQNGILLGSQTLGGNYPLTLRSIADFDGGGYAFTGSISQVSCFNRALSAYEVKQNFDFYRTRYNI